MNIEVTGVKALAKKLDALGGNSDAIIMRGLHKGAVKIQADAKKLIEQQDAVDTGRLKGSISVEKIRNGRLIGTNVEYAPYIEFGTGTEGDPSVSHTQRSSWRYRDEDGNWHYCRAMKPRPYMRTSFSQNKDYVIATVRRELFKALKARMGD